MALDLFKKVDTRKGLFAIEKVSLIYNLLTSILILFLFQEMDHPVRMLTDRLLIAVMTFLLMYLWKKQDTATPGELGKAMKTSSARVAAALNNLERKGMIVRKAEEKDRRKIRVELTGKGEEQAKQWQKMPLCMVTRLMEQMGEEDAKQMLHILKRINEIMPQIDCCDSVNEGEKDNRGGKDDIEV